MILVNYLACLSFTQGLMCEAHRETTVFSTSCQILYFKSDRRKSINIRKVFTLGQCQRLYYAFVPVTLISMIYSNWLLTICLLGMIFFVFLLNELYFCILDVNGLMVSMNLL